MHFPGTIVYSVSKPKDPLMKTQSIHNTRSGFTLIEMLVTITIIVILAGLSLGGFKYVTAKQANSQAAIQIKLLEKAIEEYKLDNGVYPPQGTGSASLYTELYYKGVNDPTNNKIYLAELDPDNNKQGWTQGTVASVKLFDPWGKEYSYKNPGTVNPDFDLSSMGQDGETDSGGPKSKDDHNNY